MKAAIFALLLGCSAIAADSIIGDAGVSPGTTDHYKRPGGV